METIKFSTLDKNQLLVLAGVEIVAEYHNTYIQNLIFKVGEDVVKVVTPSSYEGLKVMVPSKPVLVEKWQLKGQVCGLAVEENFDSEWEANNRLDKLSGRHDKDDFKLLVEKAMVPEE